MDLLIVWSPEAVRAGKNVVECELLKSGRDRTVETGLAQTAAYMDLCGADAGHRVVFGMRMERSWADRIGREERVLDGARITV